MTGGGFGGSAIVLVPEDRCADVGDDVAASRRRRTPNRGCCPRTVSRRLLE